MGKSGSAHVALLLLLSTACVGPDKAAEDSEEPAHTGAPEDSEAGDTDAADTDDSDTACTATGPAWLDEDGDGFGGEEADPCLDGVVAVDGDCDDTLADVHPGATERCDGIDNDCDGELDPEALKVPRVADADGDGYGDPSVIATVCADTPGWVEDTCDCDDSDPAVNVDLADCPAASCPAEGGIWMQRACEAPEEVRDDALSLTEDAVLTLCAGEHAFALSVETALAVVWGEGSDATSWTGQPALEVPTAGAELRLRSLSVGGASTSSTAIGLLINADGGDLSLDLEGVTVGSSSSTATSTVGVLVDGDLEMRDSEISGIKMVTSAAYSTRCDYAGVSVSGDLRLSDTTISDISFECSAWVHSGLATGYFAGIAVGGDATLDGVEMSEMSMLANSSGVGVVLSGSLLEVAGDLDATDLYVHDNTVVAKGYCSDTSCSRVLAGGGVEVSGDLSWSGGELLSNTIGLDGTMYSSGVWSDSNQGYPLAWYGSDAETLTVSAVDFGEDSAPDIGGTVEHDAEGVDSVRCDSSGCD